MMKHRKEVVTVLISFAMIVVSACGRAEYGSYSLDEGYSTDADESAFAGGKSGDRDSRETTTTTPVSPPASEPSGGSSEPIPMSAVRVGDFSGTFYGTQTLKDEANNLNVANVMVPNGWQAFVTVDWSNQSKVNPILAAFTIASPDQNLVIAGFSSQNFIWNYQIMTWGATAGTKVQQYGDDEVIRSQRETSMAYRTAEEFVPIYLGKRGLSMELLEKRDIDPATYNAFAGNVENAYNEGMKLTEELYSVATNMTVEPQGWTATMLDARYKGNINGETIYLDVLSAGDGINVVLHDATVDYYQTTWENCYICYMAAPTQELLDENREVFETVFANSYFHEDFIKLKAAWGAELNEIVTKNNLELLEEITAYWVEQHLKSEVAQQTQVDPNSKWTEVIKETDTYTTEDGGSFSASIMADGVYQNGDDFYVAPAGDTDYPQGWTELKKRGN
ncbi:hypothetical protein [Butyrivibrio sp. FCS014]|uniref:hypothetical protein n=1 Tax=Butyrivibrio sp. FCS014 TaxID=1408304 RepID=UPI0012DC3E72|nr:hypothetical protein [Butyrivibrio sp. FCS014]